MLTSFDVNGGKSSKKVKVLYIAGSGRSGTTLLDRMLGQVPGFFSGGELIKVWERCFVRGELCGCGQNSDSCDFWTTVKTSLVPVIGGKSMNEVAAIHRRIVRTCNIPFFWLAQKGIIPEIHYLRNLLFELYTAIQLVSQSKVIIDSSKSPAYAILLSSIPNIDIRIVHVIRDSRAVAFSWMRQKIRPGRNIPMMKLNPVKSSIWWVGKNVAFNAFRWVGLPYLRIHYEQLVNEPKRQIERIIAFAGEEIPMLPFLLDRKVILRQNHTAAGNPMRFRTGELNLLADDEWQVSMRLMHRLVVTGLTFSLLRTYGYSLKPNRFNEARKNEPS